LPGGRFTAELDGMNFKLAADNQEQLIRTY